MNVFLQQMLNGSNDKCGREIVMETTQQQTNCSPQSETNWMKDFTTSPTNSKRSPAPPESLLLRKSNPIPIRRPTTLPTPQAAQDFDRIIREFGINYLSPIKQSLQQDEEKMGKFVKRMVAAFEHKYMNAENSKNEIEIGRLRRRSMPIVSKQHQEFHDQYSDELFVIKPAHEKSEDSVDSPSASCYKLDNTIDLSSWSFAMDEEFSNVPVKEMQKNPPMAKLPKSTLQHERQPKIVDEFSKIPIEIEEASSARIPTMGKKLPRKHCLKKLLSILVRRKSMNKGSKLLNSQLLNNLHEEPVKKDYDSGYDDILSSTSSLVSVTSFSDVLLHQENYIIDSDRRATSSSTFQAPQPTQVSVEAGEDDCFSDTSSVHSRKIIFEDIPRSEVRLSLGPSFPLKTKVMNARTSSTSLSTVNSDDCDIEETFAPSLTKYPFISSRNEYEEDASIVPWKYCEMTDTRHEVPKSYMSKSAPELFHSSYKIANSSFEYPVSDIPTVKIPPMLRRMTTVDSSADTGVNCGSPYYVFQNGGKPHYATIKPRNRRILPNGDLLN